MSTAAQTIDAPLVSNSERMQPYRSLYMYTPAQQGRQRDKVKWPPIWRPVFRMTSLHVVYHAPVKCSCRLSSNQLLCCSYIFLVGVVVSVMMSRPATMSLSLGILPAFINDSAWTIIGSLHILKVSHASCIHTHVATPITRSFLA